MEKGRLSKSRGGNEGMCGTSVSDGGPEGQNTTTFQFKEKEGQRSCCNY